MQMNHYLWSLYLQAGGQTIVERFTAFETGDREKFAAFIRSLMQAYCPDAALIDDVAIDIDDAISALNESEEISKNEELSADKDSNLRNNPDYYEQVANNLWQTLRESLYNEVQDIGKVTDKEIFHVFCDNIVYFSVLDYAESPDMIPFFFRACIMFYHQLQKHLKSSFRNCQVVGLIKTDLHFITTLMPY